ncbi:MAG: T9SS type A sorting domain-containing protein [Bacteroidota bacterium]
MKNNLRLLLFFLWALPLGLVAQENTALTCADGIDNDGDGFIDCEDDDCVTLSDGGCATCLNDGSSFADYVIDYSPRCSFIEPANTIPENALGVSDFDVTRSDVTLGEGGSITLGFSNNLVINSGNSDPDVWVFEVGPQVEASRLELRPVNSATIAILEAENVPDEDNDGYYDFGNIAGSTSSLDIDSKLGNNYPAEALKFDAIQITDIPGTCSGSFPGADIDAVCALSSFDCTTSETELSSTICQGETFEGYFLTGVYVDTLTRQDGCDSIRTIDLTVLDGPTALVRGDSIGCAGDTLTLFTSSGVSYEWSTGETTDTIRRVVTMGMEIFVTVTNAEGCTRVGSVFQTVLSGVPDFTIDGPEEICQNGSAFYSVTIEEPSNYDFQWSDGTDGPPLTLFDPSEDTQLMVTVTNLSSGCSEVATRFIEILPLPTLDILGDETLCEGTSLDLTGESPETVDYLWSTGDTTQVITVALEQSTSISLTVRDGNGCEQSDTIDIEVLPQPTVSITGNRAICAGDPLQLAASSEEAQEYNWSTGDEGPIILIDPDSTSEVSVVVTDEAGCSGSDTVTVVVNPLPSVSLSSDLDTVCINDTAQLVGQPLGGTFSGPGVAGDLLLGADAGLGSQEIIYDFTDSLGCSNRDTIEVLVIEEGCITSIRSVDEPVLGIRISPNPFSDHLWLEWDTPVGDKEWQLQIHDLRGQLLYQQELPRAALQTQVAVPNLAAGLYLVQIRWGDTVYSTKLIRQ